MANEVKTGIVPTPEEASKGTNVNNVVNNNDANADVKVRKNKTHKQIVSELLAAGCKRYSSLKVRNITVTELDNRTRISLTLDDGNTVPGYVSDENGVYYLGETNIIFSSNISLSATLKNNVETAWIANNLSKNPQGFNIVMTGATIDIIQQHVVAGELYVNPFSTTTKDVEPFDHDTIINHIVNIKIGDYAKKMLDMVALNMMMGK